MKYSTAYVHKGIERGPSMSTICLQRRNELTLVSLGDRWWKLQTNWFKKKHRNSKALENNKRHVKCCLVNCYFCSTDGEKSSRDIAWGVSATNVSSNYFDTTLFVVVVGAQLSPDRYSPRHVGRTFIIWLCYGHERSISIYIVLYGGTSPWWRRYKLASKIGGQLKSIWCCRHGSVGADILSVCPYEFKSHDQAWYKECDCREGNLEVNGTVGRDKHILAGCLATKISTLTQETLQNLLPSSTCRR